MCAQHSAFGEGIAAGARSGTTMVMSDAPSAIIVISLNVAAMTPTIPLGLRLFKKRIEIER